jgi:N-acetyl-gamma-glutamyl-phosphate reductase
MQSKIRVGIIGGAGYTGGELIRILLNHPNTEINFVQSKSNAGNLVSKVHDDLIGQTNLVFTAMHYTNVDVLFLCAGHGQAKLFLQENDIPNPIKIIDIGNDFRLQNDAQINNRTFIYGLPELNKESIKQANNIANPGCFATAIQLGLLPLANKKLLGNDVYTTGITGSTGGGQALSPTSHFSWRANNIQSYKTLTHQHLGEIGESLFQLQQAHTNINFVPWRGDFARGIFTSSQLKSTLSLFDLYDMYNQFYENNLFVKIRNEPIHLKQVVNTNNAVIQIEKNEDNIVVHTIIDNLLKGASGQAVQNMNLMFGLNEDVGLKLKASFF